MSWIRKIFGLHEHNWQIIQRAEVRSHGSLIGNEYVLQCKVCGCMCRKNFI